MAQSERMFRDLLCESRSHPVESTDPNTARTIDDLKRQLKEAKAELEGERTKARLLVSQCDKDVRRIKDEADKKLSASLEALSIRKEQERSGDVRRVEERLRREWEADLRALEVKKNEELSRAQRKWGQNRDEEIRRAVREEREKCFKEVGGVSEEAWQKEDKLTRELFQLSQQNSTLDDQVYRLSRENKSQIEQMRRMKHEHELEIADILRQHQTEASRDFAQLRLAEQILAEREQDLHLVEGRAERERLEREAMLEEMTAIKSVLNTSTLDRTESPQSSRRSVGGVVQRRLEDLDATLKRLEEDKSNLKQENASLRKKILMDSPAGDGKGAAKDEERTRKLRKRNAELMSLVKTLEEKCKSLKSDYDHMKSGPSDSEAAVRRALSRHHAKDISEYTKQIHGKEREISELKRRLAKLEVNSKPPSESTSELEKKIKIMAMDRLKMEKVVTKLCSQLPGEDDLTVLSQSELACEASAVEALDLENQSLKRQLSQLQEEGSSNEEGSKVSQLQAEVDRLSKFDLQVISLQESLDHTNSLNSELEQRCHSLTRKLQVSELAVTELQGNADHVTSLEGEVERLSTSVQEQEGKVQTLQVEAAQAKSEQAQHLLTLQSQLDDRDQLLKQQQLLCQQLQDRLNQAPASSEVGVQTASSDQKKAIVTSHVMSSPPLLLAGSSTPLKVDLLNSSLEREMKAVGVEVADPYDSSETNLSIGSVESIKNDKSDDAVSIASSIPEQSLEETPKKEERTYVEEEDGVASLEPVLFIAKFNYNPAENSPNLAYSLELPLTAGDYVYVYGEMDGDGFYHGKLLSGVTGLVPSNFVEPVTDDGTPPTRHPAPHRGSTNLQDIQEVDEDISSADSADELIAPTDLEVERQFVDGGGTSVAVRWSPPPCTVTGYTLYLNGELRGTVEGPEETSLLLSDVPLNQLVRITVRSVCDEGESPDNATPIILNPQYPDPPGNVLVTMLDTPTSLLVNFSPHPHTITPITSYTLYLNTHAVTQLETTESTACQQSLSVLVLPRDVLHLQSELTSTSTVQLTVTASNEDYESLPSAIVGVASKLIAHLLLSDDSQESEGSEYDTAKREEDLQLRQSTHMESNGDSTHVSNGNGEAKSDKVQYYRALYSYDPTHQSPNIELAEEELCFNEGDVIVRVGGEDVDGFFDGRSLLGGTGLVPSNMVEEILDIEELARLEQTMDAVHSNGCSETLPPDDSPRVLRAVHDYDPNMDSPNDNSDVELTFSEGDLIKVYGRPDSDGFYQGELGDKKGLVPKNFVEDPSSSDEGTDKKMTKLILSNNTEEHFSNLKHSD